MKAKSPTSIMQNNIFKFALGTGLILLVPLLGNWPWTLSDFVVMGTLLFGTGLVYELVTKLVGKKYQVAIGVVLVIALILTWIELAVGIFGTPFAGS